MRRGELNSITQFFILDLKRKSKKMGTFILGTISVGRVGVPSLIIVLNLPGTCNSLKDNNIRAADSGIIRFTHSNQKTDKLPVTFI